MCGMEDISCAGVVAETLIVWEELVIARTREIMDSRVAFEHTSVVPTYALCLCLLEEYLREPYTVA